MDYLFLAFVQVRFGLLEGGASKGIEGDGIDGDELGEVGRVVDEVRSRIDGVIEEEEGEGDTAGSKRGIEEVEEGREEALGLCGLLFLSFS